MPTWHYRMAVFFTVRLCSSGGVGLSSGRTVTTWCSRSPYFVARSSPSLAGRFPSTIHRYWSFSAVRCSTSSNTGEELFKSTDSISDATGSVGVDAVLAISQPVTDFASLGLGGYWPSGWIQSAMELMHDHAHIPWWGCVVLLTAILRLAFFPVAVKLQVMGAKVANANKDAQAIQQRIMQCKASGDKVGESQAGIDMMKLYQRTANPFVMFVLGFGQVPIFLSMFRGLRGMTMLPLESLRTGGTLWFTDLVAPDPLYALSLLACASFLTNIQLGGEGGAAVENKISQRVRLFLRVGAVAIVPFTITFPAAVLVYWVSNSVFSMMQILLFKLRPVKRLFGIPAIVR